MNIQSVNKTNNISFGALYFPAKPVHVSVVEPRIKNAISNNPYIKRLSEETDVFARFLNSEEFNSYTLALDIVDIKARKTKTAMVYEKNFPKNSKPNFSDEAFISEIKPPCVIKSDTKGNISNKINKLKKTYTENNPFYHFHFFTLQTLRKALWNGEGRVPAGLKDAMRLLSILYNNYRDMNKSAMSEIL